MREHALRAPTRVAEDVQTERRARTCLRSPRLIEVGRPGSERERCVRRAICVIAGKGLADQLPLHIEAIAVGDVAARGGGTDSWKSSAPPCRGNWRRSGRPLPHRSAQFRSRRSRPPAPWRARRVRGFAHSLRSRGSCIRRLSWW